VISHGRLLRESTVAELRGDTSLRVRGLPVDRALAVAMRVAGDDGVHLDGETLLLDIRPDQAPELTRALVAADVDEHEVTAVERTLEAVFLELTGTKELENVS
jgi:ABC-2 type transport system ATP-binding protein